MDKAEIKKMTDDAADLIKMIVAELTNRDNVLELASDRETINEMEINFGVLVSAGSSLQEQTGRVRRLARELDALTDPATITEVR